MTRRSSATATRSDSVHSAGVRDDTVRRRTSAVGVTVLLGLIAVVAIVPALIFVVVARRAPALLRLGTVPSDDLSPVSVEEAVEDSLARVTPITSARSARMIADHPAAIAL